MDLNGNEPTASPPAGRFAPGDHLHVRRFTRYKHHGVYVSDSRVIQFGGRILDKPDATIGVASINEFERGGVAHVVEHGGRGHFFPPLPDTLPRDEIIKRAEWLLKNYTPGRYNVIGNNCEHMANWCVTGWYSESHQIRKIIWVAATVGAAGWLYAEFRGRKSSAQTRIPWWVVGLVASNAAVVFTYNRHIRRFWRDIGRQWDAQEGESQE